MASEAPGRRCSPEEITLEQYLNIVRSFVSANVDYLPGYDPDLVGKFSEPESKYEKSVGIVASHVKKEHDRELELMVEKLAVTKETLYSTYRDVAKELFLGKVNWGRIVLLVALTGALSQYCLKNNLERDDTGAPIIEQLTSWTAEFMHDELDSWIRSHGGWNGFYQHFAFVRNYPLMKWGFIFSLTMAGLAVLANSILKRV